MQSRTEVFTVFLGGRLENKLAAFEEEVRKRDNYEQGTTFSLDKKAHTPPPPKKKTKKNFLPRADYGLLLLLILFYKL